MDTKEFPKRELLRTMILSREGDRREAILLRQGKGWFQVPAMGNEAFAVFAHFLNPDDQLFLGYRDRPLMIARGVKTEELALDFLAREGSSSNGRNMPAHGTNHALNIFSVSTPTGGQSLPAVGAAWGLKQANKGQVVLTTIGDAATRQGEFYEAFCFAAQENLPIVFVVEDNGYGISTPTRHLLPFRLDIFNEKFVTHINGRDVFEVAECGGRAIARARAGHGPVIAWCEVDRLSSHTSADDHRVYRSVQDLEEMRQRDPIRLFAQRLIASGELTEAEFATMQEETVRQIDALYQEAEKRPFPDPARTLDHLFGPTIPHIPLPAQPEGDTDTMVAAINRTLRAGLETFPNIQMFGEDIEDPKGGVFGFTKGLSSSFPGRVVNSPLAEATIVGTAVGMAAVGYRPVFEIQFIDFITPGFHQLANQVATLRWRSLSDWTCPMVLYAPYGAYLPSGGMWHSQSNDGLWTHLPGLRVAVPSTPEDAAGLFWAAFQDEDPSLILIPKHIFRVRQPAKQIEPIPFGKAVTRREGKDVTVVSWGNGLELADQAAEKLAAEGVSIEIIDLRTLVPCDWQAIEASLSKTGRLVVIQEDTRTSSFGATILAEMTGKPDRFYLLNAPPQLVSRPDAPIPFCPTLELALLPTLDDALQAIHTTLE